MRIQFAYKVPKLLDNYQEQKFMNSITPELPICQGTVKNFKQKRYIFDMWGSDLR